jgi:hypothetical protein
MLAIEDSLMSRHVLGFVMWKVANGDQCPPNGGTEDAPARAHQQAFACIRMSARSKIKNHPEGWRKLMQRQVRRLWQAGQRVH